MINQISIECGVVAVPELRDINGKSKLSFSVAQTARKKDQDGNWIDGETSYFQCDFFVNNPTYWLSALDKGTQVVIFGRLKQDRWTDKDDPEKKYQSVKIMVDTIAPKFFNNTPQANGEQPDAPQDGSQGQSGAPLF